MAVNSKIVTGVVAGIMILAWILYIVANAVPSWSTWSEQDSSYSYSYGLWKTCINALSTTQCVAWSCLGTSESSSACSKVTAARALVTLACLFSIFSVICLLVSLALSDRIKSIVLWVGKALAFFCLIVGIIGVALGINSLTVVGSGATGEISLSWGASSIIGIIAIIVNFAGAIGTAFIKNV